MKSRKVKRSEGKRTKPGNALMDIIKSVSTRPGRKSYMWMNTPSVLSALLLWSFWLARYFSLLQWSKAIFRKVSEVRKRSTRDLESVRVNVPALFVEIYYLLWLAVLAVFRSAGCLPKWLSVYFVAESFVWVMYYSIFRRFFEENYKIHHELEYFVVLIVVLPAQALAFSGIYGTDFLPALLAVLGAGALDDAPIVSVLSLFYQVIVISIMISTFPAELTKKGDRRASAVIIGDGDVVENRLLPALTERGDEISAVFYKGEAEKKSGLCRRLPDGQGTAEAVEAVGKYIKAHSIVWIETPSDTHVAYLDGLLNATSCRLIVAEKPIAVTREELERVKRINLSPEKRRRVFYLSYYLLEKALPLCYLACRNRAYEKYLRASNTELFDSGMGRLLKIHIRIYEGEDSRAWVEDNGGHLLETMIHNVLMASLFAGLPERWTDARLTDSRALREITVSARSGASEILLEQKKGAAPSECERYALFDYEGGRLYMDLEKQRLSIEKYGCGYGSVELPGAYSSVRYSVQADLVNRVFCGELSSEECDGLPNQIECLEWLIDLSEKNGLRRDS